MSASGMGAPTSPGLRMRSMHRELAGKVIKYLSDPRCKAWEVAEVLEELARNTWKVEREAMPKEKLLDA